MKSLKTHVLYNKSQGIPHSDSSFGGSLDVLCIAPHPDDAELFCGGTLLKCASQGAIVGVCDLSLGEMASNGTPEIRISESIEASKELMIDVRFNLRFPDCNIHSTEEQRDGIVSLVRTYKPKILLLPYGDSRHPDHNNARKLCDDAVFFSNLRTYKPELGSAYAVHASMYYMMRTTFEPTFLFDISDVQMKKKTAICLHKSQVLRTETSFDTLVSDPMSVSSIEARDAFFGSQAGVSFAEPFFMSSPVLLTDLYTFFINAQAQKSFLRNS